MNARILSVVVIWASSLVACGGPTKYEQSNFADNAAIQKQASTYFKRDGWWQGLPGDIHNVAITEFSVEYVTQNTSKSGADALSVLGAAEMIGMGKRQRKFDESFKTNFPATLYNGFVDALKAQHLEVVPMATLKANPNFNKIASAAAGESYKQGDRTGSAKMEVYPVPGLPAVDDSWFKAGDNANAESALVAESGAEAGMRVRIRVALDDDGHAILDAASTIRVNYQYNKSQVWGKDVYSPTQRGSVVGIHAMRDDIPVVTGKEFQAFQGDIYTVDTEKFKESILRMYPAYARMAAHTLKPS